MCCCLKEQSKRHLNTVIWRNQVMFVRSKDKFFICGCPWIFFVLVLVVLKLLPQPITTSFTPMGVSIVTSSQFTGAANEFVSSASGLSTTQDFKSCELQHATAIGLVKDSTSEGNQALDLIFDQINTAYLNISPVGMQKKDFASLDELNAYGSSSQSRLVGLCFGLQWSAFSNVPGQRNFALEIRTGLQQSLMPNPNSPQDRFYTQLYSQSAFLPFNQTDFLQVMATSTKVIVDSVRGKNDGQFSVLYTPMMTGNFTQTSLMDPVSLIVAQVFEVLMISVSRLLVVGQEAREDIIELIMKRLGVQKSVLFSRDLIFSSLFCLVFSTIFTIILYFFNYSETLGFGLLLFFVWLTQAQSILRSNLLQHVVPKNFSGVIGVVLLIFQLALGTSLLSTTVPITRNLAVLASIIAPMLQLTLILNFGFTAISLERKVTLGDFTREIYPGVSIALVFGLALAMIAFYGLLILYAWPLVIEVDSERPLRWYYPFTPSFWCRRRNVTDDRNNRVIAFRNDENDDNELFPANRDLHRSLLDDSSAPLQSAEIELVRQGVLEMPALASKDKVGRVEISNLVKRYGDKNVVDNLSLTMFQNEILVLLGHNGAGKTTTLNILTGLTKASQGRAMASNLQAQPIDLFTDYQHIVDLIGLCPQIDVLFTEMTVRENLVFYCRLKGVERMDAVIEETLQKFNLASKANNFAKEISGGQKRKLQLAIALLGNAKIVLLDEPTSGMDPTARRETWEIIKESKRDRIIILTTHYMDEAEYLADRVAVVSKGALKVCGTTSFLKQSFGQYFYIEVEPLEKDAGQKNEALMELLEASNSLHKQALIEEEKVGQNEKEDFGSFVSRGSTVTTQRKIPYEPVTVRVDESGKVVYKLGNYFAAHFRSIFSVVDNDLEKFGIKSYSIRNMTLEQVFLAIGEQELQTELTETDSGHNEVLLEQMPSVRKPGFCRLYTALLAASSKSFWNSGILSVIISFLIVILVILGAALGPTILASYATLDYASVATIYPNDSVLPLPYNPKYSDGSDNQIALQILKQQPVLIGEPQSAWNPPSTISNYTDYFTVQGDSITPSAEGKAAYWIDASQNILGAWSVNAVVYANASSPSSVPVFGNLVLQSIAQTMTNDANLAISFKYTSFDETNTTLISETPGLSLAFIAVGNLLIFALELILVRKLVEQIEGGYIHTLLMRGATRRSYVLSKSICYFCIFLGFMEVFYFSCWIYGVDIKGWQVLGLVWCLAETAMLTFYDSMLLINIKWSKLRFASLLVSLFFMSFFGNFASTITIQPNSTILVYSLMLSFAPPAQYLIGCFLTQYRYAQYAIQNAQTDLVSAAAPPTVGPLSKYGAQQCLTIMFLQFVIYSLLLLVSLFACGLSRPKAEPRVVDPEKDDFMVPKEVELEAQRVANMINGSAQETDLVMVHNLVKRYYTAPPADQENANLHDRPTSTREDGDEVRVQPNAEVGFNAVKGTSFGVKQGEVFSLLGVNGAGKSSTFNCMVGRQRVSGGTIMLDGVNVDTFVGNTEKLHGLLGYCPQTNTFDGMLTVLQSLTLFAQLAGIEHSRLASYVNSTIHRFGLSMFVNTQARNLSGGNMRKLSLAQAMIGRPKIIFVDEASTGVDPASRRVMWKAIRHEGQESAVVLTTHAMEEAEAISSKLAIQVNGFLRSFGTLTQVKQVGKSGYTVDFNIDVAGMMREFHFSAQERVVSDQSTVEAALRDWQEKIRQSRNSDKPLNYLQEFKPYGLLERFFRQVEKGEAIDLVNVMRELLMQDTMAAIIDDLQRAGLKAHVMNYDGGYFSLEVTERRMTFGQIYALIEGMKLRHNIKEYSCKLATLEEIFNSHASQAMFLQLNQRISRRRTSNSVTSLQE